MRIGLLASFYPQIPGGAEASLNVLLDGFQKIGLKYGLWTLGRMGRRVDKSVSPIGYFRVVPRKIKLLGLPPLDSLLGRHVSRLIEKHHLDLLHAQDTYCLLGAVAGAARSNTPIVLTYHNNVRIPSASFGVPYPLTSWLDAREDALLTAAAQCSVVIANSQFTAGRLVQAGLSTSRVRTIYVGGAVSEWADRPTSTRHDAFRVLSVGHLQHHKGFHVLLQAIKTVMTAGLDVRVTIVGEGPSGRHLLRLARKLEVTDHVKFLGRVGRDRLMRSYDSCDVAVVPSITPEPFGRVAVEAMSRGKPVIGSGVGGLPEIITDGDSGFLVAPGNPTQLAERLLTLGSDRSLAEDMGRRALKMSREMFDQMSITRQVVEVYRSIPN